MKFRRGASRAFSQHLLLLDTAGSSPECLRNRALKESADSVRKVVHCVVLDVDDWSKVLDTPDILKAFWFRLAELKLYRVFKYGTSVFLYI